MSWHVEPEMLEAYAHNAIDDVHAYSVEAHLVTCSVCRTRIASLGDQERLEILWSEINEVVTGPEPGIVERFLLRLGVKDHVARLLAATPSLSLSWLGGLVLALSFAVVAAHMSAKGFLLFLILAPLLPLAGVAVAYGPRVDPTYEIGLASPMSSFNLLLIRATAVLATSGGLAFVAALALPQKNWAVIAWLVPSLGLTLASLALSTYISPLRAAAGVSLLWITGSVRALYYVANTSATAEDVFAGTIQMVLLMVTLTSVALLFGRRESFERGVRR